ncbi:glycine-rich domain-containing protein [Citrobacter braakii]|uniref:glycine-rich domain-containing protein n=1 Tax=Citrobacter braakii TaxID=57706 RepID=UPI003978C86F
MTAINFPPLCRGRRIFADFAMCNCFSKNLGLVGGVIPNKIGRLVNIQIINTSGTYTRSPQATFGYVEVIGAGGAGAGSPGINNTTDINYSVVGSGGGAGAYAFKFYQELPVTAPVIVGVGGQATYAAGNAGGTSSFNSSVIAYGGSGGAYIGAYYTSGVITNARGPSGGMASGGDINAVGEMGGSCFVSNNLNIVSGKGGASKLGSGGISVGGSSANGVPSSSPGGGGSGAVSSRDSLVAAPAQLGGAGANGIVIVWEFA